MSYNQFLKGKWSSANSHFLRLNAGNGAVYLWVKHTSPCGLSMTNLKAHFLVVSGIILVYLDCTAISTKWLWQKEEILDFDCEFVELSSIDFSLSKLRIWDFSPQILDNYRAYKLFITRGEVREWLCTQSRALKGPNLRGRLNFAANAQFWRNKSAVKSFGRWLRRYVSSWNWNSLSSLSLSLSLAYTI